MQTLTTTMTSDPFGSVATFSVQVIRGKDQGATAVSTQGKLSVGTADGVALRLSDSTVSRFHAELEAVSEGVMLRDLGSTNGTVFHEARVREVLFRTGVEFSMGRTLLRLSLASERSPVPLSPDGRFGELLGASAAMRAVYATLQKVAPTSAPVLILGEPGTGKELAARSIHTASLRAQGPYEIVDCTTLPASMADALLFGHEKDAFTGAGAAKAGPFERAHNGTIFIDELGELPLELQSKLLRVLGEGEVQRVGAGAARRKVDVRLITATNRDLRREVNAGRFRADLFYRLAVVQVQMPPLRDRLDDLPMIVPVMIERIRRDRMISSLVSIDAADMRELSGYSWPGNVRELRNWLEQYAILNVRPQLVGMAEAAATDGDSDVMKGLDALPLREAKRQLVDRFERAYLRKMLDATGGNVAEVARRSGADKATVFRAIRRVGARDD